MSHIFINHHFFYEHKSLGHALKGVTSEQFVKQIEALSSIIKPAQGLLDGISSDKKRFSITIDDGSKSVLNVVDYLEDKNINTYVCVCGNPTLRKKVLTAHKINLLRSEIGDEQLYNVLKKTNLDISVENIPLRGGVKAQDLYRYDIETTRKLKIALNYKLDPKIVEYFISDLFLKVLGNEPEWAKKLYMSKQDLESLPKNIELVYHGTNHKLWSELSQEELKEELTPPKGLQNLFNKRYFLSIPYGMEGSWNNSDLLSQSKVVKGAFTMKRSIHHEHNNLKKFWWIHRYDQIDLFKDKINLTKINF